MTAKAKGPAGSDSDDGSLSTQWFIVSDLGLTAFSGNDGIHVFVNALSSTEPLAGTSVATKLDAEPRMLPSNRPRPPPVPSEAVVSDNTRPVTVERASDTRRERSRIACS